MKLTKVAITAIALSLTLLSCTSYNAFQKAKTAEQTKDWDLAVAEYEKALDVDPSNSLYQIDLSRAKLEASRVHFQKRYDLFERVFPGVRDLAPPSPRQVRQYLRRAQGTDAPPPLLRDGSTPSPLILHLLARDGHADTTAATPATAYRHIVNHLLDGEPNREVVEVGLTRLSLAMLHDGRPHLTRAEADEVLVPARSGLVGGEVRVLATCGERVPERDRGAGREHHRDGADRRRDSVVRDAPAENAFAAGRHHIINFDAKLGWGGAWVRGKSAQSLPLMLR